MAHAPKGQPPVETLVEAVSTEIDRAPLGAARCDAAAQVGRQPSVSPGAGVIPQPNGCTPEVERPLRNVARCSAGLLASSTRNRSPRLFAGVDISSSGSAFQSAERHSFKSPRLFMHPEYRAQSQVSLTFRCLVPSPRVADGQWELRLGTIRPPRLAAAHRPTGRTRGGVRSS